MPLDKLGVADSVCSQILNPSSVSSKEQLKEDIQGITSSTVELSKKGRRLGNHVEHWNFASANMNRGGQKNLK